MVILGLGSNVGDRLQHLRSAVQSLSALLQDIRCSRILESPAMLPQGAPEAWNTPYLNMAVSGVTALSPQNLFKEIKSIEKNIGRVSRGAWGPREIDIDILAMQDKVLQEADLVIPHRGLLKRDFALLPLIDVAPDWHYPVTGPYSGWLAADIAANKGFALSKDLRDTGLKIHE
jgi:2-amino-4-hydroxy-6-hydroxymethyldihydropteridine diphosphokinase